MTHNEEERLENLYEYKILDTEPEEPFERITRLAKSALQVPIALVSLVDADRQWFKSRVGLDDPETSREVSFCSHAICNDTPFIINDATNDERFRENPLVTGDPNIRFYAGIPLKTPKGHNLGTLCVIDSVPREITPVELSMLQDLARLVVDELELRQIALIDSLTGAQTRRSFDDHLNREIKRVQRKALYFSLIIFDIDHFKTVNDTHGHATGDLVLQRVSARVKDYLRGTDIFARIGGEEFALILPDTGLVGAKAIAERLRQAIETEKITVSENTLQVTASFGVSAFTQPTECISSLMNRTDAALYRAKQKGRNRIAVNAEQIRSEQVA